MRRKLKIAAVSLFVTILAGYLIPNNITTPIACSEINKIDPESFWYYPWGESGVHKGIDIFCSKNAIVVAPVAGLVISTGYGSVSGNYIYILGPHWRNYYFAHLNLVTVKTADFVSKGDQIGQTGNTGNAAGKPEHLHFSIETIIPFIWLYDKTTPEGWKKMFYLNPLAEVQFDTTGCAQKK